MKRAEELFRSSADGRFSVVISARSLRRALVLCECARGIETGGIVIGRYTASLDCALVAELQGPPAGSDAGTTWFERGADGLVEHLRRLWTTEGQYYLGEWHFHPGGAACPSPQDTTQMRAIARDPDYRCPEPLLIILGGTPPSRFEVATYVGVVTGSLVPLDRDSGPHQRPAPR